MGMEYILYDRLQHDKQNMFSGELRERCPHDTCDIHKIKVASSVRYHCERCNMYCSPLLRGGCKSGHIHLRTAYIAQRAIS